MVRNRSKALKEEDETEERSAQSQRTASLKGIGKGMKEGKPTKETKNQKSWLTDEIHALMDERRTYIDKELREIHRE